MANTIKHKRGSGSNPSASDLVAGEIAIRTDTGVLFTKKDDNSVVSISGGSTNLGVSTTSSAVTVTSSTGNNATISEASGSAAGVMSTAHHDKLDGIEANATADQTAAEIRTLVESASDSNVFTDADHTKLNGIAAGAQVNVGTNLGTSRSASGVTITSSTGNNTSITEATSADAGVMTPAMHDKLDGIESGATADQSASEILTAVKTVDGSGSGLDADLLDGVQGSSFLRSDTSDSASGTHTFDDLRADGGNLILGDDALSSSVNYVGMKTAFQSGVSDYMIISGTADGNTYISAKDGSTVKIRGGGNNSTNEIAVPDGGAPTIGGNTIWHAGNDGAGSGLDADTLDGHSSGAFLRTNLAGTASLDITFSGGAGAATIAGNSDIRFNNGNWTGNAYGKIQQHNSTLYIAGGTNGIIFREDGSDRCKVDHDGHFTPCSDDTYDLGTSSLQWRNGYFDGTVNADALDVDGAADISGNLTLHANLDLQDNDKILLGSSDDLQIYHDGSHSYIYDSGTGDLVFRTSKFVVNNAANNENMIVATQDAAVELFYNNSKKFDTVSGGARIYGYLSMQGSGGHIYLPDSAQLKIGSGEDLQIYHDASNTRLDNYTGHLYIRQQANDNDIYIQCDNGSGGLANYIYCDGSVGEVKLHYYGTQKFNTKSDGINVVGEVECDSLDVDGSADIAGNILLSASSPKITFNSGGPEILVNTANNLEFLTSGTHRLKITNVGDVRIKDFSPRIGAALSSVSANFSSYFAASGTGGGNLPMIVERYNDNGVCIEFKRNTSVVGNINVTSTTTNYATSSDYRLKENVVDLNDAITRVKQLAPKRFNFTLEPDVTVDGFLAHEAQTVVPEAVTGTQDEVQVWDENEQANGDLPDGVSVGDNKLDEDGNTIPVYQGIDQSKLVPLLTAALQEAITKIETLEAKVAALESA